jgi:hypothetical protein
MRVLRSIVLAAAALAVAAAPAQAAPAPGSEDAVARSYHRALLANTRHVETTWNEATGSYPIADFLFVATFGNAVLLEFGDYDAAAAGVSRATLRDHTIRSIGYAAARNRYVDPAGTWGRNVYWDAALEAYFVAGAKLMWDDLDASMRRDVDAIVAGSADRIVELGADASTNGLLGGFRGDTKLEEMGHRSMPLAAALAFLPDHPNAPRWREWMNRWLTNMAGLPVADAANPALVDGTPVAQWNRAHNVFDTFVAENHDSFAPHYQQAVGAYGGRDVAQFLIAGRPVPDVMRRLPNAAELFATLQQLGTDAGVAAHLMIADRFHLYGRDVLPITYFSMVQGDRYAAAAERMLADHLEPYVAHPPAGRLTKFSGEPKYEPEARAEVAMAYLLHYWRDRLAGDVAPASASEYFAHASGTADHGAEVGLVSQQSRRALAAAVTKPGYVKFAYLPGHDDWLFDASGANPSLLPSTAAPVRSRSAHAYRKLRDGFNGTATLVRTDGGYAGFTSLPDGGVVYATSGTGEDEGALRLFNLDMPGVPGLDGDRTFTGADGSVTLARGEPEGGVDELRLPAGTEARFVRMLGERTASQFGYSIWELEVYGSGPNLAAGRAATASSDFGAGFVPAMATDGNGTTRWAVSREGRADPGSWIAVDLGSVQPLSRVAIRWADPAYASRYRVQVSDDGATWRDAAAFPDTRTIGGRWLNVDGRAGFVVRGSANPIRVGSSSVTLSAGPAAGSAGMVVEGRPPEPLAKTAAAAARPAPSGGPAALRAHVGERGHLSLFNLGEPPVEAALTLPERRPGAVDLYRGTQRSTGEGSVYDVSLAGADARVEPARFTLRERHDDPRGVPSGLVIEVADSRGVRVRNEGVRVAQLTLTAVGTGEQAQVTVPPGMAKDVAFERGLLTPTDDLARDRITFPASPLPDGMTDPDMAVDGDLDTAWRPGSGERMVVDLGTIREIGAVRLRWTGGRVPAHAIEVSLDGLEWMSGGVPGSWRYVAVRADAGGLADLAVTAP